MTIMQTNMYQPGDAPINTAAATGYGRLDFGKAIEAGFHAVKNNFGIAIGFMILFFLLLIASYITIILPLVFAPAMPLAGLYLVRGRLELSHLFVGFRKFGTVLGAGLLLGVGYLILLSPAFIPMIMIGVLAAESGGGEPPPWVFVLYILSQFYIIGMSIVIYYLYGRLLLVYPLIIERDMDAIEAIKESFRATKPDQWWLMLFFFVVNLIGSAGYLACGIGIFVSLAFSMGMIGAGVAQLLGEDPTQPTQLAQGSTPSQSPSPQSPPTAGPDSSGAAPGNQNPYT